MAARISALPVRGAAFVDCRDPSRTMRVSWRPDAGVFVLSMWRGADCIATFHLAQGELPGFVSTFVEQLTRPLSADASTA